MTYFDDLKQIININSYTKNKDGVDEVSKLMSTWFEALGFKNISYKRETIGNHNLYLSPKTDGLKILLLGHNDTVFPEGKFEHYWEDKTWIYGPGVCDMKGGNIVALQALRNIHKENGKIENIDFLLVSDEESGSDDSKTLSSKLAKDYDLCFVFEAAGKNLEVVTGRKGVGTFTINIEGKASHAGVRYDEGINANLEATYKLQALTKLTNLEIGTTVNVGKITGGIGANTISPTCELLLELRYTQNSERDRLLDALNEITLTSYVEGTKSSLSGNIQRDVMQSNEAQAILIKKIESISNTALPTEQRGGVSDANIIASQGVTTLDGFGPFGDGDHTVHERALKSSFIQRIDLMTSILKYHQKNKVL
ncbi:MAG: Acetylornithine deacetylase/Succinyl-diaminopimelate desuccinylase and related deacylases [uncultured Sulfurovum sp.]|uniref:Acetylornithine deacetylase/Succinyl-diaminopimelate desuccinylase and related deacylases n=1 Tax=uncultured Sulfurovum sp. TaxID=269237 RepID=A0A6S6S7G8_9BACT|nr:MAG: Acetylornithine deacetylase/Succinyl-diaminopimelate desuccinylase and related deacylases [uncultured Sulfurovum sp.]